jgi:hypothetical protein
MPRRRLARKGETAMATSADLAALGIGDFEPHLEASFDLRTANGTVPLKLVKIDRAGESGRPGGAFSLLFASPKGPFLPQAIYAVEHGALGVMDIFLVPIGPLADGNGYQAIFT